MYVDGASSGNPGPAGIGIVIFDHENRQVGKISSYVGRRTNNFAEYTALIRALKIAIYFKTRLLKIRTDSELVVRQLNGDYKVKNDQIKKLYDQAAALIKKIDTCKIEHIPRSQNDKADYLAKKAVR
ncbi:MAG: ribonuclease HI family protein [Spirochaetes bacterium]|nr:ribonuclease HI family protein [Spirochaetota bacterium]